MNISALKTTLYLGMLIFFYTCTFHIYYTFWMKFGTRDLKIMSLSICEFCENLQREGHAFHACINDITFTHMSTFFPLSPLQPHYSGIIPSLLRHASILQLMLYQIKATLWSKNIMFCYLIL